MEIEYIIAVLSFISVLITHFYKTEKKENEDIVKKHTAPGRIAITIAIIAFTVSIFSIYSKNEETKTLKALEEQKAIQDSLRMATLLHSDSILILQQTSELQKADKIAVLNENLISYLQGEITNLKEQADIQKSEILKNRFPIIDNLSIDFEIMIRDQKLANLIKEHQDKTGQDDAFYTFYMPPEKYSRSEFHSMIYSQLLNKINNLYVAIEFVKLNEKRSFRLYNTLNVSDVALLNQHVDAVLNHRLELGITYNKFNNSFAFRIRNFPLKPAYKSPGFNSFYDLKKSELRVKINAPYIPNFEKKNYVDFESSSQNLDSEEDYTIRGFLIFSGNNTLLYVDSFSQENFYLKANNCYYHFEY